MRWLPLCLLLWSAPAHASLQVMPFAFEAIPTSGTQYTMIEGASSWNATQANRLVLASPAGRVLFLRVELSTTMTAGATFTVTFQRELADSAAVLTFSEGEQIEEWRGSVALTAGDAIGIEGTVTAGTPGVITGRGYLLFTPTTVGQIWLPFSTRGTNASNSVENWMPVLGHTISGTESAALSVLPSAATCSALYIEMEGLPGSGNTYDFDLVENSGADTTVDCQVTNSAATCNSGADTNVSAAGDTLAIEIQPASTPTAQGVIGGGLTCVFTDTDEFLLSFSHTTALAADTTTRYVPTTGSDSPSTGEAGAQLFAPINVKAMYVALAAAPGTGDTRTLRLRLEGANVGTAVTISDTATTGNVAYSTPVQYDNLGNTESTATGTPDASTVTVSYLATVGGGHLEGATLQGATIQ